MKVCTCVVFLLVVSMIILPSYYPPRQKRYLRVRNYIVTKETFYLRQKRVPVGGATTCTEKSSTAKMSPLLPLVTTSSETV